MPKFVKKKPSERFNHNLHILSHRSLLTHGHDQARCPSRHMTLLSRPGNLCVVIELFKVRLQEGAGYVMSSCDARLCLRGCRPICHVFSEYPGNTRLAAGGDPRVTYPEITTASSRCGPVAVIRCRYDPTTPIRNRPRPDEVVLVGILHAGVDLKEIFW